MPFKRWFKELSRLKEDLGNRSKEIDSLRSALEACRKRSRELIAIYEDTVRRLTERARYYKQGATRLFLEKKELEERLSSLPSSYGVFWRVHPGGKKDEVDVIMLGREVIKVQFLVKDCDPAAVKPGSQVLVIGNLMAVQVIKEIWPWGTAVQFEERLSEDKILVRAEGDQLEQLYLSPELQLAGLKKGDLLLNCDGIIVSILPKSEGAEHFSDLEDISGVDWSQIGGLSKVVRKIQRVLLPFKEREAYLGLFKGKNLPKGIILHGPPGCGKTKCAKAIANDLARARGLKPYFMEFAGAELTDKYVGETARKLREIFARAKEKAKEGALVLIFIDEIDSLFRSRERAEHEPWIATDIGQFNSILDGMDPLGDILVIGATNQKDLVDKAILRPGRLGIDVYISRPTTEGDIKEILRIYLVPDLPFAKKYFAAGPYRYLDHFGSGREEAVELSGNREKIRKHFVDVLFKRLAYDGPPKSVVFEDDGLESVLVNNRFRALTSSGDKEVLLKDYLSGAVLESIVDNAKTIAFARYYQKKREDAKAAVEITKKDFFRAVDEEMQRLKNSFNPSQQKSISGFQG